MSFNVNESIMPGTLGRLQEKEQLQLLNDRFSAYVQRVRLLSEQSNQVDSSAFLQNAQILEDEITNLKNLYEKELDAMRKQIDDVNLEKSSFQVKFTHQQQQIGEMQDRLIVETDKNRKLMDEFNGVHRKVRLLEQELDARTMEANKPFAQSQQIQRDFENLSRENHSLKQRYEGEQVARQQAQDKLQQVLSRQELAGQVHTKQVDELRGRLGATMTTILGLEARVRELSRSDSSITEVLRQVREAAELELRKYQAESEESYNKNLMTLQTQLLHDAETVSQVTRDKQQLQSELTDLQGNIRNLENQIAILEQEKATLEGAIVQERQRQAEQVHMLEGKARSLQGLLVARMQEASAARDANVPLRAEIDALRILLEEEENRLNVPLDTSPRTTTLINSTVAASHPVALGGSGTVHADPVISYNPAPAVISYNPAPAYGMSGIGGPTYTNMTYGNSVDPPPVVEGGSHYVSSHPEPIYQASYQPMTSTSEGFPQIPKSNEVTAESKYIYETTPSMNKLQMEPDLPESSRPVGPVRAKSAPSTHSRSSSAMNLGQGRDYFDEMFTDLKRDTLYTPTRPLSTPVDRPPSSTYNDYSTSTTSAIGNIKILEVQQDGKYIRLTNDGGKDVEIGGFIIQQNVGGHPVAVFRFPPRTKFPGESMITVWASNSGAPVPHQPPADFVWEEQMKWGTGPECTTILCKPNGQAVAWSTAAHRFTKNAFEDSPSPDNRSTRDQDEEKEKEPVAVNTLTERNIEVNGPKEPVYLRREKQHAPVLTASKHPHGAHPLTPTHPHTGQTRPLTLGNDNSTFSRQSRSQTTRPDPIPGQPYAGASGQRLGSSPLRRYTSSQPGTVRGTGAIANRSAGTIRRGPATPFLSPLQQEFFSHSNRSSALVQFS